MRARLSLRGGRRSLGLRRRCSLVLVLRRRRKRGRSRLPCLRVGERRIGDRLGRDLGGRRRGQKGRAKSRLHIQALCSTILISTKRSTAVYIHVERSTHPALAQRIYSPLSPLQTICGLPHPPSASQGFPSTFGSYRNPSYFQFVRPEEE